MTNQNSNLVFYAVINFLRKDYTKAMQLKIMDKVIKYYPAEHRHTKTNIVYFLQ